MAMFKTVLFCTAIVLAKAFSRSSMIERANHVGAQLRSMREDPSPLETVCQAVEASFAQEVKCKCSGFLLGSFSISCNYVLPVCSIEDSTRRCGKPEVAVSVVDGSVFSATTCVRDSTRGMLPVDDTCVFVDACASGEGFCDCTASFGGLVCSECQVCEGGASLTVDCRNVNAEAISTDCAGIDLDLDLEGGSGSIAGFAPVMSGFCSTLEGTLDNRIACDCTDAHGGSYDVTCRTTQRECLNDHCGSVESKVAVASGEIQHVTSCTKYEAPFGETCTTLDLCEGEVCGCRAHYDGTRCADCELCEGGILLDCSNVYQHAVIDQCQRVSADSAYEFLPNYSFPPETEQAERIDNGGFTFATKQSSAPIQGQLVTLTVLVVSLAVL